MSPVSAPSDRRFRRVHVKPSRRRGSWRRVVGRAAKYGVLIVLGLYAAYRGGGVVIHARMLQIDRIVVRGTDRLSSGEVLAVLGGLRGENIVSIDLAVWRRRLLASPWVRDAALRRALPSTVEVHVSERQPVGIARLGGDLYLVDEGGVVIDQYGPQYADVDLPIIDGLTQPANTNHDEKAMEDAGGGDPHAELAARVIASLRSSPEVARRLSQIDVSNLRNVSVIVSGDPAVIYVGEDRFLIRLQSYLELAEALRERVPDIDYVDLRFDERIYVRPAGGRQSPVTGLKSRAADP